MQISAPLSFVFHRVESASSSLWLFPSSYPNQPIQHRQLPRVRLRVHECSISNRPNSFPDARIRRTGASSSSAILRLLPYHCIWLFPRSQLSPGVRYQASRTTIPVTLSQGMPRCLFSGCLTASLRMLWFLKLYPIYFSTYSSGFSCALMP
ncbi:uncharacterized protein BDW70DRAFT_136519, partial [Aspergillus foveolatus]|uniref:uncharacterized protein n=1 Tax=Aspergillus foveolatus TaxID=210207 RepID=UPI003CCD59A6